MKKISFLSILFLVLFLSFSNETLAADEVDCTIALVTSDYAACNSSIDLVGILSGSSSSGVWSVTGETGTLGSSTSGTVVRATYTVGSGDAGKTLTFRLTASGGSCDDAFDELPITIENGATANAGIDFETCVSSSLLSPIPVSGTIGAGASSGNWSISSGAGILSVSTNTFPTVTAQYTPTLADVTAGFIELELTTDDPDGAGPCNPATDIVKISLNLAAIANAGADFSSCGTTLNNLSGTIGDGATTGSWTALTGTGLLTNTGGVYPNFTATYTPSLADIGQTLSFRFTAVTADANCPDVTDDINITILAEATADAGVDSETCINANALSPISVSGLVGGAATSGNWSITTGNGALSASTNTFPNVTADYTPVLADIAVGFVELTLTTDASGICSTVNDLVRISLTLAPTANAGSGFTICENTPINLSGTLGDGATSGAWSLLTGTGMLTNIGGVFPNVTADYTPTAADATTGFVEFTLTANDSDGAGPCSAATDIIKIDITKNASTATTGVDANICQSSYANLGGNTPAIGTGSWTKISGGGVISNPNSPTSGVTNLSVGVNTFRWIITNGVCPSTSDEITITRDEAPTMADAGFDFSICDINIATLGANTPAVGTGTWTVIVGTGIITTPNSPTSNVINLSTGTNIFRWSIANGMCSQSSDDITITINTNPVISFSAISPMCLSSGKVLLNQASPTGGAYSGIGVSETAAGTGVYEFDSDASGVVAGLNSITYDYIDPITGCTNSATRTIQLYGNPVLTQDSFSDFCVDGSPIVISGGKANGVELITIPGASYTYSGAGVTSLGGGIFRFDPVAAGAGIHNIALNYVDANGCNAMEVTIDMTVNSLPAANPIVGKTSLCVSEKNVTYNVTPHASATYTWSLPLGFTGSVVSPSNGILTDIIDSSITLDFGPAEFVGDITVTETISGCVGNAQSLSITAYSEVVADAGTDHTICNGESATIGSASTATGGSADYSYAWTPTTGLDDASIANPTAAPNTTTNYTVEVTDNKSGCTVATDEVVVTVNPLPMVTFTDIATLCSEDTKYQLTEGSPTGGIYSGVGVTETATGSGMYEFNPSVAGAGAHTIDYTYIEGSSSCQSSATTTINVEICTGIEDDLLETFSLYPNPSNGHVTIDGLVNENELVSVAVYDKLGKVVYQTQTIGKKLELGIDLGKLTKGIYFVKLKSDKTEYQLQKVVIQ